jgi:hypothetical protein
MTPTTTAILSGCPFRFIAQSYGRLCCSSRAAGVAPHDRLRNPSSTLDKKVLTSAWRLSRFLPKPLCPARILRPCRWEVKVNPVIVGSTPWNPLSFGG